MSKTIEEINEMAWKRLNRDFQNDEEFQEHLTTLIHFYGRKFIRLAKQSGTREFIEETFEDFTKSLFFQGYMVMKSILTDEAREAIPAAAWKLPYGQLKNEMPVFIETIFGDSTDWYRNEQSNFMGKRLIDDAIEGVYDLLKQVRKDIVLHGAIKAFMDDDSYVTQSQNTDQNLKLGSTTDLKFVNPQAYMSALAVSAEQEVWDLYYWSSIHANMVVGNAHLSSFEGEADTTVYLLNLIVLTDFSEQERYEIADAIVGNLPEDVKANLKVRLSAATSINDMVVSEPT